MKEKSCPISITGPKREAVLCSAASSPRKHPALRAPKCKPRGLDSPRSIGAGARAGGCGFWLRGCDLGSLPCQDVPGLVHPGASISTRA